VAIDWQAQLDQLETIIQNYNDAIIFLTANPTEEYTLNTGQSEQKVKRHNLANMNKTLDSLYNRYSTLCLRIGVTPTISLPAW
jgi:hypothetical protein